MCMSVLSQIQTPLPYMAAAEFKPDWIKALKKNRNGEEESAGKRLDTPAFFAAMEALALGYHAVGVRMHS